MNLTPKERFSVVCSLVKEAAAQRQMHGDFVDRQGGESLILKPIEMEALADRIEQEGQPNGDLLG